MNNFFDVLNKRYSCRSFSDKTIDNDTLTKLLSVLTLTPSACNFLSTKVLVINDPILLEKLKEVTRFTFDAKTILIVCHDKNISWHRRKDNKDHGIIDSSISATYLMLQCFNLGLGTTYVSAFNDELCHELLNIDNNLEINCILPIGYPSDNSKPSDLHFIRKSIEEIVSFNKF